jgi:hypothetical protein
MGGIVMVADTGVSPHGLDEELGSAILSRLPEHLRKRVHV